jgi:hemerythrin-like metal-binding protein
MAFVEWKERYSVGQPAIDKQHRALLEIMNQLHDAMKHGAPKREMMAVMASLVRYTQGHFQFEEEMLAKAGYPKLAEHHKMHAGFVAELNKNGAELAAGRFTAPIGLLRLVKDWLVNHILVHDQAYATYFESQGKRALNVPDAPVLMR